MAKYERGTARSTASINDELEKIQNSLADKFDRKPSSGEPNQLETNLDMNGNRIYNLPDPQSSKDAVPKDYVDNLALEGLPVNLGTDKVFQTLPNALNDLTLTIGDTVRTLGYYSSSDGGGAEYVVVAGGTGVEDGGSYHNLVNGLQLKLIHSNTVDTRVFGVRCDGSDESQKLQHALDSGVPTIIHSASEVFVKDIQIPDKVTLINAGTISAYTDANFLLKVVGSDVDIKGGVLDGKGFCGQGVITIQDSSALTAVSRVSIKDCELYDGAGNGIYWKYVNGLDIAGCTLEGFNKSAIQNTETVYNGSRNINIIENRIKDITNETTDKAHGISINSWNSVRYVNVQGNVIENTKSNGVEIWASYVRVMNNVCIDTVISYSFGVCQFLVVGNNISYISEPTATSGTRGAYGIEIGGCRGVTITGNTLLGNRVGIDTTTANITGSSDEYFVFNSDDINEWGKFDIADWPATKFKESAGAFVGSPYTTITGNTIVNSINAGIALRGNFGDGHYVCSGNTISMVNKSDTAVVYYSAIYVENTTATISGNVISECEIYGINSSNGKILLGNNTWDDVANRVVTTAGVGAKLVTSSHQIVSRCPDLGDLSRTKALTQGTYNTGDTVYYPDVLAGDYVGKIVTQGGTLSTNLNTRTATTVAGSNIITVSSAGDFFVGAYITITGVTGVKKITNYFPSDLTVQVDVACDATVSGASISNSAPVFKSFGSISL